MLSPCATKYLLAIYELSDGGAAVRSVDIANALGVTRASVVKCLKILIGEGLVHKEYYGNVMFTPLGAREASGIYTEYTLLYAYFYDCLHTNSETARRDAVAALCFLTPESREKLSDLALQHQVAF